MNSEENKEKEFYEEQYGALELSEPSNVVTGIIGAIVGSLIGVALWIGIYHLGYIASIAGVAIIFCALKGYEILGHSLDKKGVIIVSIIALFMVFAANHLAWTTEIYLELKNYGDIAFMDILKFMSNFISEADVLKEYLLDLGMGYVLTLIGGISTIVNKYKQAK